MKASPWVRWCIWLALLLFALSWTYTLLKLDFLTPTESRLLYQASNLSLAAAIMLGLIDYFVRLGRSGEGVAEAKGVSSMSVKSPRNPILGAIASFLAAVVFVVCTSFTAINVSLAGYILAALIMMGIAFAVSAVFRYLESKR